MYKPIYICLLFLGYGAAAQFRRDYTYVRETDAFYKLHIRPRELSKASSTCRAEGSRLMEVTSEHDVKVARGLLDWFPGIEDPWISSEDSPTCSARDPESCSSSQGSSWRECGVLSRSAGSGDPKVDEGRPFVCKIEAREVQLNSRCEVYSAGYEYYDDVNSCYMLSNISAPWHEAYSSCRADGAHLAVIDSEMEREKLVQLMKRQKAVNPWYYVGVRALQPSNFKTVFNQTVSESAFEWLPGMPNNDGGVQDCGVISSSGKLRNIICKSLLRFICEKN